MRIKILKHANIIVDGRVSWVDEGDTFTKIGATFQDDNSCFSFYEEELLKIQYEDI